MTALCRKSRLLTGYLELLLEENLSKKKALMKKATQEGVYYLTSAPPLYPGLHTLIMSCKPTILTRWPKYKAILNLCFQPSYVAYSRLCFIVIGMSGKYFWVQGGTCIAQGIHMDSPQLPCAGRVHKA